MNKSIKVVLSVAVVILAIGAFFFPRSTTVVERAVGSASGPTHTSHQEFLQNFTNGGNVTATTSTEATFTLTSAYLNENVSLISWLPNLDNTLTTMASTSAPFVNMRAGDSFTVYLYNASTTAASTITLAAGTGVDLQEDEGATVVVNGGEISRLTFLKKADTDVVAWLEVGQIGD